MPVFTLHLTAISGVKGMESLLLQSGWFFLRKLLLNWVSSNGHPYLFPSFFSWDYFCWLKNPASTPEAPVSLLQQSPSSGSSFLSSGLPLLESWNEYFRKSGRFRSQDKLWLNVEIVATKQQRWIKYPSLRPLAQTFLSWRGPHHLILWLLPELPARSLTLVPPHTAPSCP